MNTLTTTMLGFSLPQGGELILIFFVVLLLFGAKKLPELARGMGKAINEFKRASSDIQDDIKRSIEDEPKPSESEKKSEAKSEEQKEPSDAEAEKPEKEPAQKS